MDAVWASIGTVLAVVGLAFAMHPSISIDTLLPNKYCRHRIGDKFFSPEGGYNLICRNCNHITEYKSPSSPPAINTNSNAPVAQLDRADAS